MTSCPGILATDAVNPHRFFCPNEFGPTTVFYLKLLHTPVGVNSFAHRIMQKTLVRICRTHRLLLQVQGFGFNMIIHELIAVP